MKRGHTDEEPERSGVLAVVLISPAFWAMPKDSDFGAAHDAVHAVLARLEEMLKSALFSSCTHDVRSSRDHCFMNHVRPDYSSELGKRT